MTQILITRDVLIRTRDRSNLNDQVKVAVEQLLGTANGQGLVAVSISELPLAFLKALLDDPHLPPNQQAAVAIRVHDMSGSGVDAGGIAHSPPERRVKIEPSSPSPQATFEAIKECGPASSLRYQSCEMAPRQKHHLQGCSSGEPKGPATVEAWLQYIGRCVLHGCKQGAPAPLLPGNSQDLTEDKKYYLILLMRLLGVPQPRDWSVRKGSYIEGEQIRCFSTTPPWVHEWLEDIQRYTGRAAHNDAKRTLPGDSDMNDLAQEARCHVLQELTELDALTKLLGWAHRPPDWAVRRTIRRGTRRGLDRILSPDKKRRQRRLEPRWVELAAKHLGLRVDEEIARLCQSLETDQAPDPRAILLRAHRKLTERIGPSWWEYVQHTATGPEHALVTLAIEEAIRETLSTPDRRQIRHLPAVLSLDGRIAKAAVLFLDGRLAKNGSKYGVCPATDRSSIDMEVAEKALGNFSEQERNIWDDKVNGKSNRQIAKDHGMTEKEVRHVCERIRRTLAAVLRPSHGDEDAPSVGRSMLREVRTATYSNRPHVSFQSLFPRPAR